jgi:hypothetical protein
MWRDDVERKDNAETRRALRFAEVVLAGACRKGFVEAE